MKLACRIFGHDPEVRAGIETGELTEPGGEPRKVKIALIGAVCKRCGTLLELRPQGIVSDPLRKGSSEE